MPKSICITSKRIPRVRDINPDVSKTRSIKDIKGFAKSTAKISFENRRFSSTKKSQDQNNAAKEIKKQKLETSPKTLFWGSAVDIDI